MAIRRLRIDSFRNLQALDLYPGDGANVLLGPNAAGKTSIIEAIAILGRGRSFRTHRLSDCIAHGASFFRVMINCDGPSGSTMLGIERTRQGWRAKHNGQECRQLSILAKHLPLIVIEPEMHFLISGGPRMRRRYLDWGLFHVEPDFLDFWQQHERAINQCNRALRAGSDDKTLDSLALMLAPLAERLHSARALYVTRLVKKWESLVPLIAPTLSDLKPSIKRGWTEERSLSETLLAGREQDRRYGYLHAGAHRDELVLRWGIHSAQAVLSRGQQKLAALTLLLAQLGLWQDQCRNTPLILIDDLFAELDRDHQIQVLSWLKNNGLQFWMTATDWPAHLNEILGEHTRFHVEQGRVQRVI